MKINGVLLTICKHVLSACLCQESLQTTKMHMPFYCCYMTVQKKINSRSWTLFGTTRVSRYQKGKTKLDFTEARDSEWQWHLLGHVQICASPQTHNHASIPPLGLLQSGCLSCCPTNQSTEGTVYITLYTIFFISM